MCLTEEVKNNDLTCNPDNILHLDKSIEKINIAKNEVDNLYDSKTKELNSLDSSLLEDELKTTKSPISTVQMPANQCGDILNITKPSLKELFNHNPDIKFDNENATIAVISGETAKEVLNVISVTPNEIKIKCCSNGKFF